MSGNGRENVTTIQTAVARHPSRVRLELILEGTVVGAAIATIPLTILQIQGRSGTTITAVDWLIWMVFFVEYLALLAMSTDRLTFARRNWLAATVIIVSFPVLPHLLAFARLARLARLTRLIRLAKLVLVVGRGLSAIRHVLARRGLVLVAALTSFLIISAGALMSILEPATVKGGAGSGVWWAIVTATTVGYGDISPSSTAGRIVAGIVMLVGIGLVSTIAASIAAYFVGQDESHELAELRDQLNRIEALLTKEG